MIRTTPGQFGYLGLIQLLFLTTWTVYVVFLGDLLAQAGLPRGLVPTLLLVDQVLFALADVLLGRYADRAMGLFRRLAPLVLGLNLVACAAFALLPRAGVAPWLLIGLILLWVLTSSVLRAPLYALIARRSEAPGQATAAALFGMGLAGALAPYLGTVLKGLDPLLPFVLSAASLALATLGFAAWERRQVPPEQVPDAVPPPPWGGTARLLAAMLLLGAGFQLNAFVNAAPLYKALADPALLPWLLPIFWGGFSLAAAGGMPLLQRFGARRGFAVSALVGTLAVAASGAAPVLPVLAGLQFLAGLAWGGVLLGGLVLAGAAGRHGREGRFIGAFFACLALGAAGRIGLTLAGIPFSAAVTLPAAVLLWGIGTAVVLSWLRR